VRAGRDAQGGVHAPHGGWRQRLAGARPPCRDACERGLHHRWGELVQPVPAPAWGPGGRSHAPRRALGWLGGCGGGWSASGPATVALPRGTGRVAVGAADDPVQSGLRGLSAGVAAAADTHRRPDPERPGHGDVDRPRPVSRIGQQRTEHTELAAGGRVAAPAALPFRPSRPRRAGHLPRRVIGTSQRRNSHDRPYARVDGFGRRDTDSAAGHLCRHGRAFMSAESGT
jgi:hypothetical protein